MTTRKLNGLTVRVLREAYGIRHADFARRIEISPGYLTRLELGARQPKPDVLRRIALGLGVSVETISYPVTNEAVAA